MKDQSWTVLIVINGRYRDERTVTVGFAVLVVMMRRWGTNGHFKGSF
jgi:hypothetical protein